MQHEPPRGSLGLLVLPARRLPGLGGYRGGRSVPGLGPVRLGPSGKLEIGDALVLDEHAALLLADEIPVPRAVDKDSANVASVVQEQDDLIANLRRGRPLCDPIPRNLRRRR